jgi:para-nitrobenzyl esterase
MTLALAEDRGAQFSKKIGKPTLAALRAMPAEDLQEAIGDLRNPAIRTPGTATTAIVDGWFLPQDLYTIFEQGKQNDFALITGSTNDEGPQEETLGGTGAAFPITTATYTAWARQTFGARADAILGCYPAKTDAEAASVYHDIRRDIMFAAHRAWARFQLATGKSPIYLYNFSHVPPHPEGNGNNPPAPVGALHSSDVMYVLNTMRVKDYPWTDVDRRVSDMLGSYWTNFAKTLNPNGQGLPSWPVYNPKDEFLMNFGDAFRPERFNSAGMDLIAAAERELRRTR